MLRQGAPSQEFTCPDALRAHYRAVGTRLHAHPAPRPPEPTPAEWDAADRRARETARLERVMDERAALDNLVFQVLDPERLAREPKRIIARIAEARGFTRADILGRSKKALVVRARQAAIAAVQAEHPHLSLPQLGRIFDRDHTTIIHALRQHARRTASAQHDNGDGE